MTMLSTGARLQTHGELAFEKSWLYTPLRSLDVLIFLTRRRILQTVEDTCEEIVLTPMPLCERVNDSGPEHDVFHRPSDWQLGIHR